MTSPAISPAANPRTRRSSSTGSIERAVAGGERSPRDDIAILAARLEHIP